VRLYQLLSAAVVSCIQICRQMISINNSQLPNEAGVNFTTAVQASPSVFSAGSTERQ